jgi:hypothetical protein
MKVEDWPGVRTTEAAPSTVPEEGVKVAEPIEPARTLALKELVAEKLVLLRVTAIADALVKVTRPPQSEVWVV